MPQEYIFLRVGNAVPFSYHQIGPPIYVPWIHEWTVKEWARQQPLEITSLQSRGPWRECLPSKYVTIELKDGRIFDVPDPLVPEGWDGGGWFIECELNPIFSAPLTVEKYETRRLAREEADAMEDALDWY